MWPTKAKEGPSPHEARLTLLGTNVVFLSLKDDILISYILAELFCMCLKKSCFPDCWKVAPVVLVFKNVGESSMAKNYCRISLLSVVSTIFEKIC